MPEQIHSCRGMSEYLRLTDPLVTEVAKLIVQAAQLSPEDLTDKLQLLAAARYRSEFSINGGDENDAAFDAGRDVQLFAIHVSSWLSKLT